MGRERLDEVIHHVDPPHVSDRLEQAYRSDTGW